MNDRFTLPVGVFALLVKDNKTLLMKRQNSGWHDGDYDLVAGHIDGKESLRVALIRELREEVGLDVQPDDLRFAHLIHFLGDKEYIYVLFKTEKWGGEPIIKEPEYCSELRWFPLMELPTNITPNAKQAIEGYLTNNTYSEMGF